MPGKISVIVRTYHRGEYLRQAVSSLLRQTLPLQEYEIIVVDNDPDGSARKTVQEIISCYRVSNVRYIQERKISASRAANTGVKNSTGDLIAFLDDDTIAEKDWLTKIMKNFSTKRVDLLAGKIILKISGKKLPGWVKGELKILLGELDLGSSAREMKRREFPLLMNMALRKDVFFSVGGFPENIGFQDGKPYAGEENALVLAARKKKYRIFYDPEVVVYHLVTGEKFKRMFFLKRKSWEGRARFRIDRMFKPLPLILGIVFFRLFIYVPVLSLLLLFCLVSNLPYDVLLLAKIFRNLNYFLEAFSLMQNILQKNEQKNSNQH